MKSVGVMCGCAASHAVTVSPSWSRAANMVAENTFTPLNVRSGRRTRPPEASRGIEARLLLSRSCSALDHPHKVVHVEGGLVGAITRVCYLTDASTHRSAVRTRTD